MENTEGLLVALYRLTQGFDPVVIIWTSTLALALAYFLIAKILEPFWPAPTRTGPGSGANSRGPANGLGREIGGRGRASDGPPGAGSDNPWELSEDVLAKLDPAVRSLYLGFKSRISHGGQGSGVGSRCGRVTISTCGTIFREKTPRDLRKSATLIPSAADVVRAISLHSRVFLITQVEDDQSASNVDKALAEAKITAAAGGKSDESCASSDRITSAVGPVRSHHVLFCEKHVSKVSMARQIEPALHVDNDKATARELQRFLPRVLLITDKPQDVQSSSSAGASPAKGNLAVAQSLHSFCTLPPLAT